MTEPRKDFDLATAVGRQVVAAVPADGQEYEVTFRISRREAHAVLKHLRVAETVRT
jgi:hypothetical protein